MNPQEGHYPPWVPAKDTRVYSADSVAFDDAIRANDVAKVRRLILDGKPLDELLPQGHRPITLAAELGHISVLRALIGAGADPEVRTSAGRAAIHCANDPRAIEALLDAGVDLNMRGPRGETALFRAAGGDAASLSPLLRRAWGRAGSLPLVNLLLGRGADTNLADAQGTTALMVAAKISSLRVAQRLIATGAHLDMQDNNGCTALMLAVHGAGKKRLQIAEALIGAGANPNIVRRDGMTALRYACCEGDSEILSVLIRGGADVNFASQLRETALTTLVHNAPKDRYAMAKLLLEAGANPSVRISDKHPDPGRRGKMPRDLAADKRDKSMLALLDKYTHR